MAGSVGGVGGSGAAGFEPESPILDDPSLVRVGHGEAVLKSGSRGEGVKDLQRALVELGHLPRNSGVDGIFGRGTANAVAAFQRSKGLTADGKVGRLTLQALDTALRATGGSFPTTPATPPPPPEPTFATDAERRAYADIKEKLFIGARAGRFDLAVTDAETNAVLDKLDALPPAEYRKVLVALGTHRQRPDDSRTFLDTLVIKGTSDVINLAMTERFWKQMKSKLGALGDSPKRTIVPLLSTVAEHHLMAKVRLLGIE